LQVLKVLLKTGKNAEFVLFVEDKGLPMEVLYFFEVFIMLYFFD